LPRVRMDREATRPVPINRRAPTALLVATTDHGRAIATQAESSVQAASARDAADAGVDGAAAMGARTPPTARRAAMTGALMAVATPTAGRSSQRGRTRLRTPIQRLVPIPLPVPRRWVTLKRRRGRRRRPGRTRQPPPSSEHPRCRRRLRPARYRRRGRSKRHRRRPVTTASMSCGRPLRAMCHAAVRTTASSPVVVLDSG